MSVAALFPNYTQMRARVSPRVWHAVRVLSVGASLMLCAILFFRPQLGLLIFWGFIIPFLPLLFFVAPGLWRNSCPLAAMNQTPRLLGFTRGLTLPPRLKEYAYVVGISLVFLIIPARKALFNQNGPALALLLLGVLGGGFVGGLLFKGKSGWCSTFCPLLPIQRIYGQTPFVMVPNSHCNPCVGCVKNCYDFNPPVAYLADLAEERHYSAYRKFFAAAFPGVVLAFYSLPDPPAISVPALYLQFALYILASVGIFFALDSFVKVTANTITALYAMAALNLYYWFNIPLMAQRLDGLLGVEIPPLLTWAAYFGVLELTLVWLLRTYRKERLFQAQAAAASAPRVSASRSLIMLRASQAGRPEITFLPDKRVVVAKPGATLLEIAEGSGLRIESGCRIGICGADPVAIVAGMDKLSSVGNDERTTLGRLGLAENTRMACCARVKGNVSVSLTPERPRVPTSSSIAGFKYDRQVARVVIVGHGIAGATAADHARRRHPTCEIHLVGSEPHHLYNRMAISRLIYGRSAMQGLYLLPEAWYEEHTITSWLNTRAVRIDRDARQVVLGTGETLGYDRLILAMGSGSSIAPIEGFGRAGTFVLREAEDALRMRAFAQEHGCRHAVIGGGGLLGLEAAYALLKLGLRVAVLERSEWLLRRQLDRRAGELVGAYLEGLGIEILHRAETAVVHGNGKVDEVKLKDDRSVPCDLFLLCAGITPNVALARDAGLAIKRGVIVDEHMRTSAPDILAAGDVAEYKGEVLGLWPAAVDQAEVAAINAIGGDKVYAGTVPVTMLKVVGIDLASLGRFESQADDTVVVLEDAEQHGYRKLVIAPDGTIAGAIVLGYPQDTAGVTAAIKREVDVRSHLPRLRSGDWRVLSALAE